MKVKVLLVDDHTMLRSGLRALVSQQDDFVLVGEASTGGNAVEQALAIKPDLVLMDIHLPDMNGMEASRKILAELHLVKIIIFSSDVSRALVEEALHAGISGYILKTSTPEEIVQAMTAVIGGKLYVSSDVSAEILKDYGGIPSSTDEKSNSSLSERETQLLRLVSGGRRNKEIAETLELSVKSVEASRSRLMKKLGCGSSAEMIRYAVREGIAQP
jgi:two-component system, NarL family, response regulator NreC